MVARKPVYTNNVISGSDNSVLYLFDFLHSSSKANYKGSMSERTKEKKHIHTTESQIKTYTILQFQEVQPRQPLCDNKNVYRYIPTEYN
jgi:hypothetical protein